jgi:DNA-binding PadR family transcriptional regulator
MPPLSPDALLPLKDLVFRILVVLGTGERHGWGIARSLTDAGGERVLPGHLYRTLDSMLDLALIDERDEPTDDTARPGARGAAPTRFFRLTAFGRNVAVAETTRLEALITRSRAAGFAKAKAR